MGPSGPTRPPWAQRGEKPAGILEGGRALSPKRSRRPRGEKLRTKDMGDAGRGKFCARHIRGIARYGRRIRRLSGGGPHEWPRATSDLRGPPRFRARPRGDATAAAPKLRGPAREPAVGCAAEITARRPRDNCVGLRGREITAAKGFRRRPSRARSVANFRPGPPATETRMEGSLISASGHNDLAHRGNSAVDFPTSETSAR